MRTVHAPAAIGSMLIAAIALTACASTGSDDVPARVADVTGVVTAVEHAGDEVRLSFEPDEGGDYYEGTVFVIDDSTPLTGAVPEASAIVGGDRIGVWTGACAESFPVQCAVEAVEVME